MRLKRSFLRLKLVRKIRFWKWDLAWDLLPEQDYMESQVNNYDLDTHLVIHGGVYQGRRIAGTLYFVRVYRDIPGVTEEAKKGLDRVAAVSQRSSRKKRERKVLSKKEVAALWKRTI